jgi:hypothetical protein
MAIAISRWKAAQLDLPPTWRRTATGVAGDPRREIFEPEKKLAGISAAVKKLGVRENQRRTLARAEPANSLDRIFPPGRVQGGPNLPSGRQSPHRDLRSGARASSRARSCPRTFVILTQTRRGPQLAAFAAASVKRWTSRAKVYRARTATLETPAISAFAYFHPSDPLTDYVGRSGGTVMLIGESRTKGL